MSIRIRPFSICLMVAALFVSAGPALSEVLTTLTTAPTTASVPAKVDPKADELLREMCDLLRNARSFSVSIESTTKVRSPGMRQEMFSAQTVAMQRPNKIAVESTEGMSGTVISDGKQMLVHFPMMGKYAIEDAPATLDELAESPAAGVLGAGGVGAVAALTMLADDPYAQAMESVESLEYVELRRLDDGTECHVLRFIQPDMNMDVWVQAAPAPRLARRIVPDMSRQVEQMRQQMPGMKDMQMEMSSDLSDWQIDPQLPEDHFAIVPPAEGKKVDSVMAIFGMEVGEQEQHSLLGQPAPPFALELLEGGTADLAQHKDKDLVVLDFWATWCGPCVKSLPILAETLGGYQGQGVVFYAVNQRETPEQIRNFLQEKKLQINVALDAEGKIGDLYGVTGIPQTVVIDKDGIVQSVHVGFNPGLKKQLKEELDALLAGQSLLKSEADAESPPAAATQPVTAQ